MRYRQSSLAGFGYELAPVVVTSEDLEDALADVYRRLHIPPGQLEALTGIAERRWWEPGYALSEGAARAAERALRAADVSSHAIEHLVYAGVCREHFEPATACHVAERLAAAGLPISEWATVHDVANACLGVCTGILEVANRIELGQIRAGLVVSCESAREINEITIARLRQDPTPERFRESVATFTGGSGAVAVVVTHADLSSRRRLVGAATHAAPRHHALCRWGLEPVADDEHPGHCIPFAATQAAQVLEHGVEVGRRTWSRFLEVLGCSSDAIDRTVCHQVGAAHRTAVLTALGRDPALDFATYAGLGNTGSVALPSSCALADERGFLQPGHRVGLLGIGSGINCTMIGVDW